MVVNIMIVDDEASMRELFLFILQDEGWHVSSYNYHNVDLNDVQSIKPDLIILDINMHQAGVGWAFLQRLKMDDATAPIPVLISTTAGHLSSEIESYLAARHIAMIHKPFNVEALFRAIEVTLERMRQSETQSRTQMERPQRLPVLVIEDDEILRKLLVTVLKMEGHEVLEAATGLIAFDMVLHRPFGLILTDIGMPMMTGVEFIEAYGQQVAHPAPVIVLTGDASNITEPLPSFVVEVIAKPFDIDYLMALINRQTRLVTGEANCKRNTR